MASRAWLAAAVLVLCLTMLACGGGGGGGGGTGPTVPPAPTGKRFQFSVFASPLDGALVEAAVALDGRELSRRDWPATTGSGCTLLCTLSGDVRGLSAGNHTVTFMVVRQTRAAAEYVVNGSGVVTDAATGEQRVIFMPRQNHRLRAGQTVTYTVFL